MGVGPPRLDSYRRMLDRFYEPLVLLQLLLGKESLGPHLVTKHDASNVISIKRRFLSNLAYLCDHRKGGDSTTAIGLEESDEGFTFWIAINTEDRADKAKEFLRRVLADLREVQGAPKTPEEIRDQVLASCATFAKQRVKQEAKNLSNTVKKYKAGYANDDDSKGKVIQRS